MAFQSFQLLFLACSLSIVVRTSDNLNGSKSQSNACASRNLDAIDSAKTLLAVDDGHCGRGHDCQGEEAWLPQSRGFAIYKAVQTNDDFLDAEDEETDATAQWYYSRKTILFGLCLPALGPLVIFICIMTRCRSPLPSMVSKSICSGTDEKDGQSGFVTTNGSMAKKQHLNSKGEQVAQGIRS
ncbi:hypothetical protein M513_07610 [Trichuris suis]|uniref:Uncharacterized protein n=1 Tax=Trichuris suis TaxID=68888 RepID=A0A085M2W4_9BILA|nr:hypothetical protein M513_07610 [Trichuris suis]